MTTDELHQFLKENKRQVDNAVKEFNKHSEEFDKQAKRILERL